MDWENPQILKLIRLVAQSAWRYERDSARTEFPKACKFATDDAITASYFRHKVVEVYRGGEIIEI